MIDSEKDAGAMTGRAVDGDIFRSSAPRIVSDFPVLEFNQAVEVMAQVYVDRGIFLARHRADALHVAFASVHHISYLPVGTFSIW